MGDQVMASRLDLDKRGPGPMAGHHLDQAIRPEFLFAILKRDLDEGRNPPRWCPHRGCYRASKFSNRLNHGEKGRRGSALLLISAADPRNGKQACALPLHLTHNRPLSSLPRCSTRHDSGRQARGKGLPLKHLRLNTKTIPGCASEDRAIPSYHGFPLFPRLCFLSCAAGATEEPGGDADDRKERVRAANSRPLPSLERISPRPAHSPLTGAGAARVRPTLTAIWSISAPICPILSYQKSV